MGYQATFLSRLVGGTSLQVLHYQGLFAWWLSPANASLAYAVVNIALWYLVLL